MMQYQDIVTIDGPSGVGKSSVSKKVAAELGYTYLDTGAMYRGVGLYFHRQGIAVDDESKIAGRLTEVQLELLPAVTEREEVGVVVNGEDVSPLLRTPELSMIASKISALPSVRGFLTEMQRQLSAQGKVVAEGRDMGTVVFPKAAHKFFLDADPEERCRRRVLQLRERGEEVDEKKLLQMILQRDRNDSQRAVAPLKRADDAQLINTTALSFKQVCTKILQRIKKKTA
ncbi:MAG: (d)CMP kinase [Desulfopila sp.]|jgi:cytidylate kinase|nr:(d)CMP kinase [Desulfopila sp.]